ncbi:hypothetical protein BH09BAC3_BH09BAC3_29030 [soil metagenome]
MIEESRFFFEKMPELPSINKSKLFLSISFILGYLSFFCQPRPVDIVGSALANNFI